MNAYNIIDVNHGGTVLYHAIARDEEQVKELAGESNIDLTGMTIELEKLNVRDELDRNYPAKIEDALVY